MVLIYIVMLCLKVAILQICPTSSPHWRETLSTGQKKTIWMCTFPCFCAGKQAFVCTQSADFVRKDLTYCSPALFVIMYILTLSNVVHGFKFGCEVNVGTGLQQKKFSLLKEHELLLGYNYGNFLTVLL